MKDKTGIYIIKFIIYVYLACVLLKLLFPFVFLGLITYFTVSRIKKNNQKVVNINNINEKEYKSEKKDEFKDYILSELYKLSEKCNLLENSKKMEYLKLVKEVLDNFIKEYEEVIEKEYESGISLKLETEETVKMKTLAKITELEKMIDNELEKNNKKSIVLDESSELKKVIEKELSSAENVQKVLSLR